MIVYDNPILTRASRQFLHGALIALVGLSLQVAQAGESAADKNAAFAILQLSGFRAGMCAHLGCGNGTFTAALGANEAFVVHGLDPDESLVKTARARIRSAGIYGRVSVERHGLARLPYATGLINVVVVHDTARALKKNLSIEEMFRALCPKGVVCMSPSNGVGALLKKAGFENIKETKEHGGWVTAQKPRPPEMDEWTHWRHGPDYIAVSQDTIIETPNDLRWTTGRVLGRGRTHIPLLSAGGRVFVLEDDTTLLLRLKKRAIRLKAYDAFNGLLLWQRKLGFPPSFAPHPMVVVGDRLFTVLERGKPVTALNAATGEAVRSFDKLPNARRLLVDGGLLIGVLSRKILALDPSTGEEIWSRQGAGGTVVSGDGKVFFLKKGGSGEYGCLDLKTGAELWRKDFSAWKWPTGKAPKGGMIFIGYKAGCLAFSQDKDTIHVVSAKDGSHLWHSRHMSLMSKNASRLNFYFADGLWWVVHPDPEDASGKSTVLKGLDPETGAVKRTHRYLRAGSRCHAYTATVRYNFQRNFQMTGFVSGETSIFLGGRGGCMVGRLPANGLIVVPQSGCACDIWIPGVCAFEANPAVVPDAPDYETRLEKGPSYGKAPGAAGAADGTADEWPTYRHDAARSGSTASKAPADCALLWSADAGARPTACTVAGGKVFVASQNDHSMRAFDADTGQAAWTYTAGARVDSPPTIYGGLCLFGCRDGWVYGLDAADGALVWRFRAAQEERLIGDHGRLESAWPVHGTVVVNRGAALFAAGRNAALRGGIDFYRLDLGTGEAQWRRRIQVENVMKPDRPLIRSDVLVGDGASIFAGFLAYGRFRRLDYETGDDMPQRPEFQGIQMGKRTGFLPDISDGASPRFSYLSYGGMSGRLLAYDKDVVCGLSYGGKGKPVKIGEECFLLSLKGLGSKKEQGWKRYIGVVGHAMILTGSSSSNSDEAGKIIWLAGVKNTANPAGGTLLAYSARDGKKLNDMAIEDQPTWDGMAAAYERLYVPTKGGKLLCFGKRK